MNRLERGETKYRILFLSRDRWRMSETSKAAARREELDNECASPRRRSSAVPQILMLWAS